MRIPKEEILVNVGLQETRVVILEDKRLEDFYVERSDSERLVGNIYKGKVESILPGMGAAFVDLGLEKNGFLYVSDVFTNGATYEKFLDGEDDDALERATKDKGLPSISDLLKKGDEILVQIVKEPIGTKGCRLTTHISIPGHFLVLMPIGKRTARRIGLSKRIEDRRERDRLRKILEDLKLPEDVCFVVRTASIGASRMELTKEARYLLRLWVRVKRRSRGAGAPRALYEEYNLILRTARDMLTDKVRCIEIDSVQEFRKLNKFLGAFSSRLRSKLVFHRAATPLFEKHDVERQIDKIYNRVVRLRSGGYIVIDETESLVAVDVNTGRFVGKRNLEETAFKTNLEAVEVIARQLRLRDLGGIVVLDFIDMEVQEHRRAVFKSLERALERDRARSKILNISRLGLVEMTRQRMRKSLEDVTYQKCPHCGGRGLVKSAATLSIEAVRRLEYFLAKTRSWRISVTASPEIAGLLLDPKKHIVPSLQRKFRKRIQIAEDPSLRMEDMRIEEAR